jgi:glutamine phosphoribosylpyrophosphate amidotransferase
VAQFLTSNKRPHRVEETVRLFLECCGSKQPTLQRGFRFQTHNDSELIAVYLADKLAQGASLEAALKQSVQDFDGTFTYLVSTREGIGYAKDKLAAKPLVVVERDDVVALASEEVALRRIFPEGIDRTEPQQSLCRVWLN